MKSKFSVLQPRLVQTSSTEYPYGTYSLQYGHDMNALTMSLEASAGDFANALAIWQTFQIPSSVNVVRTTKDDIYSWTVTFPARYGRASLLKVKSSCGDNFDGDYDF